jgi:hypothetical protein
MTVKEMGAARRMLGGLLALSQNRLYGKSGVSALLNYLGLGRLRPAAQRTKKNGARRRR